MRWSGVQIEGSSLEALILLASLIIVLSIIIVIAGYKIGLSGERPRTQAPQGIVLRIFLSPWTQCVILFLFPFCIMSYTYNVPTPVADLILIAPGWSVSLGTNTFVWYSHTNWWTNWWAATALVSTPVLVVFAALIAYRKPSDHLAHTVSRLRYLVLVSPLLVPLFSVVMVLYYSVGILIPLPTTVVSQYLWYREIVRAYNLPPAED
nr:MAG: hypothetical protein AM324_01695 [Candidatus Thorarchaeota archaeon SMTZ1-83]